MLFHNGFNGYSQLKFTEVVRAAKWLGVTIDDLMDDAALVQDKELRSKMRPTMESGKTSGALVGAGSPRFLVKRLHPDAPIEGGISGVAKGALAGPRTARSPVRLGFPIHPSKHDAMIGVSGRSQAHETLGTMTTIIMSTSEGDIKINLFDDETPETVANFLGLATGEKEISIDPMTGQPSP